MGDSNTRWWRTQRNSTLLSEHMEAPNLDFRVQRTKHSNRFGEQVAFIQDRKGKKAVITEAAICAVQLLCVPEIADKLLKYKSCADDIIALYSGNELSLILEVKDNRGKRRKNTLCILCYSIQGTVSLSQVALSEASQTKTQLYF